MLVNDVLPPEQRAFDPATSISRICNSFGFRYHAVCMPGASRIIDFSAMAVCNFSPRAIALFDRALWWDRLSDVQECLRSGRPSMSKLVPPDGKGARENADEFRELMLSCELDDCLTVPLHCGSQLGFAYFLGKRLTIDAPDVQSLQISMLAIFQRMQEMRPTRPVKVTPRETECLLLTSRGHTSQQVAAILDISEHTVVRHLTSATQKLSASNRGQAVATAIRLGIMD